MARKDQLAAYASAASRPRSGGRGGLYSASLAMLVCLVASVAGFLLPHLRPDLVDRAVALIGLDIASATTAAAPRTLALRSQAAGPALTPFGEVEVNLADERLTRHLRVRLTLQIERRQEAQTIVAIETQHAILKNWLISYLSDKSVDEIRGAAGVNRTRREIQDQFNSLLFTDGSERIQDVLFEEFTVR